MSVKSYACKRPSIHVEQSLEGQRAHNASQRSSPRLTKTLTLYQRNNCFKSMHPSSHRHMPQQHVVGLMCSQQSIMHVPGQAKVCAAQAQTTRPSMQKQSRPPQAAADTRLPSCHHRCHTSEHMHVHVIMYASQHCCTAITAGWRQCTEYDVKQWATSKHVLLCDCASPRSTAAYMLA
jgi:hypothetical protein